jgi:hypothetical protein
VKRTERDLAVAGGRTLNGGPSPSLTLPAAKVSFAVKRKVGHSTISPITRRNSVES